MDLFGSASRFRWPAPRHPRVRRPGRSSSGSGSFGEPRRQGVQGFPKATYSSNNATPKMTKKIVATDIWTKMLTGKAQSCFLSPSFTFINLQNDVFFNGWSFFFKIHPPGFTQKQKSFPFREDHPSKNGEITAHFLSLSLSLLKSPLLPTKPPFFLALSPALVVWNPAVHEWKKPSPCCASDFLNPLKKGWSVEVHHHFRLASP